ncbi:MAG: FixH family protein [Ferruginibacter sp.]
MNWGHKIILVYAVFVAGMLFLAFKSSKQNIELVTEDYYAKELVYQQKIDETKRAELLSAPVSVTITQHELSIRFPKDFLGKPISGEATIYCPSDEKKDMRQPFNVMDNALMISIPANYHGLNYVKLNWSVAGVNYYCERKLIIQ